MATPPVIPDGMVDVIWEPGRIPWLAGPDTGPHSSSIADPSQMVRVQFRRGRAGAALRLPLDHVVDARVDLDQIWPDERWHRIEECITATEAQHLLLDVLRDRMPTGFAPDIAVEASLAGRPTGLSDRQLRRRFCAAVGFGPKTLERIDRFGRFRELATTGSNLADAAAIAGYADQPHLTRECRRLTGLTPTAFLAAA